VRAEIAVLEMRHKVALKVRDGVAAQLRKAVQEGALALRNRDSVDSALSLVRRGAEASKYKCASPGGKVSVEPRLLIVVSEGALCGGKSVAGGAAGGGGGRDVPVLAWARAGSGAFAKGLRLPDLLAVSLGSGSPAFAAYRASMGPTAADFQQAAVGWHMMPVLLSTALSCSVRYRA
jgi:hypothetical protein